MQYSHERNHDIQDDESWKAAETLKVIRSKLQERLLTTKAQFSPETDAEKNQVPGTAETATVEKSLEVSALPAVGDPEGSPMAGDRHAQRVLSVGGGQVLEQTLAKKLVPQRTELCKPHLLLVEGKPLAVVFDTTGGSDAHRCCLRTPELAGALGLICSMASGAGGIAKHQGFDTREECSPGSRFARPLWRSCATSDL
eukprot:symbB.v1.2.017152.t1/scaffold1331.1/size125086/6